MDLLVPVKVIRWGPEYQMLRNHCVWSGHVRNMLLQCLGVLSVYLATILHYHHEMFFDTERENIPCSIICVSLLEISATSNLYYITNIGILNVLNFCFPMVQKQDGHYFVVFQWSGSLENRTQSRHFVNHWKTSRPLLFESCWYSSPHCYSHIRWRLI